MTNEEILEEIQPYKPSEIFMCMDLARADERERVKELLLKKLQDGSIDMIKCSIDDIINELKGE